MWKHHDRQNATRSTGTVTTFYKSTANISKIVKPSFPNAWQIVSHQQDPTSATKHAQYVGQQEVSEAAIGLT